MKVVSFVEHYKVVQHDMDRKSNYLKTIIYIPNLSKLRIKKVLKKMHIPKTEGYSQFYKN